MVLLRGQSSASDCGDASSALASVSSHRQVLLDWMALFGPISRHLHHTPLLVQSDQIVEDTGDNLIGVPDFEPAPWYRFGTGCTVLSVQIVHGPGHIGNDGRSGTHRI